MAVSPAVAAKFIHSLSLGEGKWAGQPFKLWPFQKQIIQTILARDPATKRRLRSEVVVGIPRKNAKTTLIAALGIALLVLDGEPGNLIAVAAKTRGQAGLLLQAAKRLVRGSKIGQTPLTNFIEVRKDFLYFPETDSYLRAIAAEAQGQHGLNPGAFIVDEGHAALETDRELYDTLLSAQGARRDPLGVVITTGGPRPAGPMYDLYRYGKEVEAGLRNDPRFAMIWYEPSDPNCDITDVREWYRSCPALGAFVEEDYYRQKVKAVLDGKAPEFMFRRLHLNQWTSAAERWLPWSAVQKCGGPVEIPDGAEVFLAIDAALSRDTFAVSMVYVAEGLMQDENGVLRNTTVAHVKSRAFSAVDGGYIDPEEVKLYVLGIAAQYTVVDVAYDPAYLGLLRADLEERGLPMEPFPQDAGRMTRATETFQRLFLDTRVRHGGDRMLLDQIANIGTKPTERGVRISKVKSAGGKVDMPVSLAMALDRAFGDELGGDVVLGDDD